jgi:Helix-turn-helix domain
MPEIGIGATLREARMRARIDVSEIEAQTKIRAKYLRALENEEWDLLPGPTFVKSFLRTYAQALGLDGRMMVEEYRLHYESPSDVELQPISPRSAQRARQGAGSPSHKPLSRGYVFAFVALAALVLLLIVAILGGGSSTQTPSTSSARPPVRHRRAVPPRPTRVYLRLVATGPVYVCLLGDGNRKLIPGSTLQPGTATPVYGAKRFLMTFGNNSLTMHVDGHVLTVPPSSTAIGYVLTPSGRHTLAAGHLPTCA